MKKYYVVFIPSTNTYLKPVARDQFDTTSNIAVAGTWETEESALLYIDNDNFSNESFMIIPKYIRF